MKNAEEVREDFKHQVGHIGIMGESRLMQDYDKWITPK